jgi:hypothetical protein
MKESVSLYERLAKRGEFNSSVRHIKASISILDRFAKKENLADLINESLAEKSMTQDEILATVNLILGDKYPYAALSANLCSVIGEPAAVAQAVQKWNGVDLILVYFHPDIGTIALNPKNTEQMSGLDRFAKNECITVYAGSFVKNYDGKKMASAAEALIRIIEGKAAKAEAGFLKGDCAYRQVTKKSAAKPLKSENAKAPKKGRAAKVSMPTADQVKAAALSAGKAQGSPAAAQIAIAPKVVEVAAGPVKMTPMYAVVVTNELFHNGNVEAWKRIIESYTTKYPNNQVYVYYDGERITNLNSLFKWGKVKRGTCIEFKVAGEQIVDVAKLQRYLRQGASHLFEAFLKFPVNTILPLF